MIVLHLNLSHQHRINENAAWYDSVQKKSNTYSYSDSKIPWHIKLIISKCENIMGIMCIRTVAFYVKSVHRRWWWCWWWRSAGGQGSSQHLSDLMVILSKAKNSACKVLSGWSEVLKYWASVVQYVCWWNQHKQSNIMNIWRTYALTDK